MFQKGQLIIYGGEGVCRVDSIGTPDICGVDQERLYYTLSPLYHGGKVYAPVDTRVMMRPVITKNEAMNLITQIPVIEEDVHEIGNPRLMNDYYQAALSSQDCSELVRLIKTVYKKRLKVGEKGKKLGQIHQRYMKRAEELLFGELAVALDIPKDKVLEYIEETIDNGLEHIGGKDRQRTCSYRRNDRQTGIQ